MKAKELRERTTEDLAELKRSASEGSLQFSDEEPRNQLDDTSLLNRTKKDIARIELILGERTEGGA